MSLCTSVPEFFTAAIRAVTKSTCKVTLFSNHPLPRQTAPSQVSPLPELLNVERVTITIDGSYKDGEMGC
jgi:hypothetical protein